MADVVVVDDSQFMRVQIREILEKGGHTVVGEAGNGKEAVAVITEAEPDVVTMDVKMPGVDGIEAVERVMNEHPTPVLMLSRYTEEGADTTLEALDAGAVDFMMKPDGEVTTGLVAYADDLVELVEVVANADVEPAESITESTAASQEVAAPSLRKHHWETPPTLVIAASTGGPSEIHTIMEALPATSDLRVVIVQHMPEQFTDRFAERLDQVSEFDVREAADGDRIGPGEAVVAKGGSHLEITDDNREYLTLALSSDPPVHSVRPAADVTLESAGIEVDGPLFAVVLSGMGRDGAAGVESLAANGGTVLVQNPNSASISSMPDNAIETGVVEESVDTAEIPERLVELLDEIRVRE